MKKNMESGSDVRATVDADDSRTARSELAAVAAFAATEVEDRDAANVAEQLNQPSIDDLTR
jgi:hypothetical protein